MLRYLAITLVALLPTSDVVAAQYASIKLAATNVTNYDPMTFLPATPVDVYHVSLCNCNTVAVASLQARFEGSFVNNNTTSGVSFKETADLPILGPFTIADSFFVLNENVGNVLPAPGQTVDNGSVLAAAYTLSGVPRLIPAIEERVIAVLSMPTGSPALGSSVVSQLLADVGGVFGPDYIFLENGLAPCLIPEPTTCVLAGLALVGAAARRRV